MFFDSSVCGSSFVCLRSKFRLNIRAKKMIACCHCHETNEQNHFEPNLTNTANHLYMCTMPLPRFNFIQPYDFSLEQFQSAYRDTYSSICCTLHNVLLIHFFSRHIDVAAYFIFKFPFMPIWNSPFAEKAKRVFFIQNQLEIPNIRWQKTQKKNHFNFICFSFPCIRF